MRQPVCVCRLIKQNIPLAEILREKKAILSEDIQKIVSGSFLELLFCFPAVGIHDLAEIAGSNKGKPLSKFGKIHQFLRDLNSSLFIAFAFLDLGSQLAEFAQIVRISGRKFFQLAHNSFVKDAAGIKLQSCVFARNEDENTVGIF